MVKTQKRILTLLIAAALLLVPLLPALADDAPTPIAVERIEGNDRYDTSLRISQAGFSASKYAVIASGESFPDALAGGQLAGYLNAPLLVTPKAAVSEALLAELDRLEVTDVFLLGGEGTLSNAVQEVLAAKYTVERLSGADRFATSSSIAVKIASLGTRDGATHFAYGYDFPDALAAAPYVVSANGVMLLVDGKTSVTDGVALGGEKSVPGTPDRRIAGSNRYATAVAIAEAKGGSPTTAVLVDGTNYPDALSASGFAHAKDVSILLTHPKDLPAETATFLKESDIQRVIVIGGTNSVSENVVQQIQELKVATPDTEPATEPATEPVTEPVTEPATEPVTEPSGGYDPSNPRDGLTVSPYPGRNIKGNISSTGEKIYHVPGQRDYEKTVIDESKGERWFETEQEAVAAGWRKAKR